jgi:hypothetical protein
MGRIKTKVERAAQRARKARERQKEVDARAVAAKVRERVRAAQ